MRARYGVISIDTYMRQWIPWSFMQVMAFLICDKKPLPEPVKTLSIEPSRTHFSDNLLKFKINNMSFVKWRLCYLAFNMWGCCSELSIYHRHLFQHTLNKSPKARLWGRGRNILWFQSPPYVLSVCHRSVVIYAISYCIWDESELGFKNLAFVK